MESYVGETIKIGNKQYIISGIIDTKLDETRYKPMKFDYSINDRGYKIKLLSNELNFVFDHGLHNVVFVRRGYYATHYGSSEHCYRFDSYRSVKINFPQSFFNNTSTAYSLPSFDDDEITWLNGTERTELKSNEVILSRNLLHHQSNEDLINEHMTDRFLIGIDYSNDYVFKTRE